MKYTITSLEGDFEPSSNEQVLKNKLGIIDPSKMLAAENELLLKLYKHVFEPGFSVEALTFQVIKDWHRMWLGPIYPWAGELRTVDMSKTDFRFAAAKFLDRQIKPFEEEFLQPYQQLTSYSKDQLVAYLAKAHVEFILIHPFREGNGRLSRLLMDVLVTQAGFEPLDYSLWSKHKDYYFKAIQAGVAGNYEYMEGLVNDVLKER